MVEQRALTKWGRSPVPLSLQQTLQRDSTQVGRGSQGQAGVAERGRGANWGSCGASQSPVAPQTRAPASGEGGDEASTSHYKGSVNGQGRVGTRLCGRVGWVGQAGWRSCPSPSPGPASGVRVEEVGRLNWIAVRPVPNSHTSHTLPHLQQLHVLVRDAALGAGGLAFALLLALQLGNHLLG